MISSGVRAISRSWNSRLAENPTEASTARANATGSAGRAAKNRYGAARSSSIGVASRPRQRCATNRPATVSPMSIPSAAKAKSSPACPGAYGTNSDSQPTISPFGTQSER